jgi:GH18 family chitinase
MTTWRQKNRFGLLLVFLLLLWWTGGEASVAQADPVVMGYFISWGIYGRNYTVDNVPFDNLTHINYAFLKLEANEIEKDITQGMK